MLTSDYCHTLFYVLCMYMQAADTSQSNYDEALGYEKIAKCLNITGAWWIAVCITVFVILVIGSIVTVIAVVPCWRDVNGYCYQNTV